MVRFDDFFCCGFLLWYDEYVGEIGVDGFEEDVKELVVFCLFLMVVLSEDGVNCFEFLDDFFFVGVVCVLSEVEVVLFGGLVYDELGVLLVVCYLKENLGVFVSSFKLLKLMKDLFLVF